LEIVWHTITVYSFTACAIIWRPWIPHEAGKPFTFEHAKEAVEVFNKAGRVLRQNGITLQYHPHGYEFAPLGDGTILDYMLENIVDAQFQMDVFWINSKAYKIKAC